MAKDAGTVLLATATSDEVKVWCAASVSKHFNNPDNSTSPHIAGDLIVKHEKGANGKSSVVHCSRSHMLRPFMLMGVMN